MTRQYVVVGLGRVGASLVATLVEMGHEVLGIERREDIVQDLAAEVPSAHLVQTDDITEPDVLRGLGVEHFDGAAVTIGEDIEASVLVTLVLKELGLPFVLSRANTSLHARVLRHVGADHVVQPEREFGEYLAHRMAVPGIEDYLQLGEDDALVRMDVPERWVGKSLADLRLPDNYGLTVMTIKREGMKSAIPQAGETLRSGDVLVIGGPKDQLDRLNGVG